MSKLGDWQMNDFHEIKQFYNGYNNFMIINESLTPVLLTVMGIESSCL